MNKEKTERKKKAIKKARFWFYILIVFFLLAFILIIKNAGNGEEASDYEAETIFEQDYTETEKEEVEGEESEEPFRISPAEFELLEGEFMGISYTTWIIGIVFFIFFQRMIRRF